MKPNNVVVITQLDISSLLAHPLSPWSAESKSHLGLVPTKLYLYWKLQQYSINEAHLDSWYSSEWVVRSSLILIGCNGAFFSVPNALFHAFALFNEHQEKAHKKEEQKTEIVEATTIAALQTTKERLTGHDHKIYDLTTIVTGLVDMLRGYMRSNRNLWIYFGTSMAESLNLTMPKRGGEKPEKLPGNGGLRRGKSLKQLLMTWLLKQLAIWPGQASAKDPKDNKL